MRFVRLSLALILCCGIACADSIILTGLDTPLGEQNQLWINEQGTNTQLYWAGGINAKIDNKYTRVLWCVELFVNIGLNTTYNTTIDWADTPQLKRVGWMMANTVQNVTTQAQGAAFQLAIWDIIEDNGDGFAVGAGKVYQSTSAQHPTDATVLSLAAQYEAQSVGKSFTWTPIYNNVTLQGVAVQDLIGPLTYDNGPLGKAPEPGDAGLVAGGLAMIGFGWWRSRHRRGAR